MIYTVTLNPSLDYNVSVTNLQWGLVNRTTDERIYVGGKGINVSIVLKNLGVDSTALGFVAGFTGREIQHLLAEQGVKEDFLVLEHGLSRINVKIHEKETTEVNGKGPVPTEAEVQKLFDKLSQLEDGDILVLAGSVPGTMPKTIYEDMIRYVSEKDLKIVVDATGDLLKNVLPCQPFLVKPNIHELGELFNVKIKDNEEVILYAKKLQDMGAKNVLVSMGKQGAILVSKDHQVHQSSAPEGEAKNPVGAGDSMVAGFLAGYLQTEDYAEALKLGICAGSATALSEWLGTGEEIWRLHG